MRTNRPRYALATAILLGATAIVYGLALATAQDDGPPGPGWRETTPKSLLQHWRDGTDRQGRARRAREAQKPQDRKK